MTINDELKTYDDAFKNYLWVKVFDDNVFAIIKSNCISFFLSPCFKMVSFRVKKKAWAAPILVSFKGLIQNFWRASPPLLSWQFPPPPPPGQIYNLIQWIIRLFRAKQKP